MAAWSQNSIGSDGSEPLAEDVMRLIEEGERTMLGRIPCCGVPAREIKWRAPFDCDSGARGRAGRYSRKPRSKNGSNRSATRAWVPHAREAD